MFYNGGGTYSFSRRHYSENNWSKSYVSTMNISGTSEDSSASTSINQEPDSGTSSILLLDRLKTRTAIWSS